MERQSEQELLEIAPVETEVLEGNRIYKVTGRELTHADPAEAEKKAAAKGSKKTE